MDAATRNAGGGVTAIVEYDYTAKEPDELDLVKGALIHSIKQTPGGWWEGTLQATGRTGMFPDNFVRVIDANDEHNVTLRDKASTSNRRCKVIYSYTQVNDDELSLAVGDVIEFLGEVEEGWWRGRLKNKIGVFPSNFVITIESSPVLASKRPVVLSNTSSTGLNNKVSAGHSTTATKKTNRLSFHNSREDLLNSSSSSSSMATATTTVTATSSMSSGPVTGDDMAPSLPPKPQREYCRVEFPYAPQNEDELELKVGDVITIISMDLPDKGWWKGELRGRVGVFPDNFVKLLPPSDVSPLNDSQHTQHSQYSQKTAKSSNVANSNSTNTVSSTSTTSSLAAASSSTLTNSSSTKVFIKKSGSTSSTQSSNRKDSFGSRDSLNDILSETGLQSGNVAAQRKSLESKNLELLNAPDASVRLGLKKQQQQQHIQHQHQEVKSVLTNSSHSHNHSHTVTTTNTSSSSNNCNSQSTMSSSELRKSLEGVDEKIKTPPPVLTKKPNVPTKKSTTVTSVAGNIFSGLKQKVKNVENKLTTAASHDYADGLGSSKLSPSGIADSGSGGVQMRRAATIAVEDSDFDRVERASILTDMRAGRVKAPKRRPPSAAINVIGESNNNNNNSIYLNGGSGTSSIGDMGNADAPQGEDGKLHSSDDNSTGEEHLAKPKPREWEKKKAPWMEELKASQVKKKTSPSVEPRTVTGGTSVAERTSKLFEETSKITNSTSSNSKSIHQTSTSTSTHTSNSSNSSSSSGNNNNNPNNSTKMQSASISTTTTTAISSTNSSSILSNIENSQHLLRKELNTNASNNGADAMTKSLSGKMTSDSAATSTVDDVRARPNSLSIRNRSISPSMGSGRSSGLKSTSTVSSSSPAMAAEAVSTSNSHAIQSTVTSSGTKTNALNNHNHSHNDNNIPAVAKTGAGTGTGSGSGTATIDSLRVVELERRVEKLETVVQSHQRTIDELIRTLREETDRVKVLRGELDKYAQCVTQV